MIASLNQTLQSGCVMNVNAPHKIFELWGNGFSESVIISDSKDEYRRGGAEKQHSVEFTGICVCTFETPSLKNQPWLCWRRIHTGLTYWLKLPHSTFKEVAQHYSTSAFFKRIVFLKSECINVWLSVNWICQRQVCLVFYFCGKFELSFFNILSLKVIGVVLPPRRQAHLMFIASTKHFFCLHCISAPPEHTKVSDSQHHNRLALHSLMPWISLSIKEEKNERNMLENSLKA